MVVKKPSRQLIGRKGSSDVVRLLPGGKRSAKELFNTLGFLFLGEKSVKKVANGKAVFRAKLPGGGNVSYRSWSKSGGPKGPAVNLKHGKLNLTFHFP